MEVGFWALGFGGMHYEALKGSLNCVLHSPRDPQPGLATVGSL